MTNYQFTYLLKWLILIHKAVAKSGTLADQRLDTIESNALNNR